MESRPILWMFIMLWVSSTCLRNNGKILNNQIATNISQKRWGWWLHSEGHINLVLTQKQTVFITCVFLLYIHLAYWWYYGVCTMNWVSSCVIYVRRAAHMEISMSSDGDIHVQWQGSSTDQPKPKTHHICESIFIHTHANTWNTISLSYPETYMAWLMTLDFSSRYSVILAEDNRE